MKKISLLFFSILLSTSLVVMAKQNEKITFHENIISIPDQSKLSFNPEKSGKPYETNIVFTGEVTLTGILQIYWMATWPNENDPGKALYMRFFPDKKALASLPTVQEKKRISQPKIISLSIPTSNDNDLGKFSEERIRELLKDSQNLVPDNFFKYKERYVLVPVSLRFSDFSTSIECDARYFHGTFIGMERDPKFASVSKEKLEKQFAKNLAGCGAGTPYDEGFHVKAKSGNQIEIRSSPDHNSKVSSYMKNDTPVLKLKTIDDNWLYIQVIPESSTNSSKTKNKPVFGYIYTPALELEVVN